MCVGLCVVTGLNVLTHVCTHVTVPYLFIYHHWSVQRMRSTLVMVLYIIDTYHHHRHLPFLRRVAYKETELLTG